MAVARGCGSRIAGGLYLETKLGPTGRPVTDFLMDPVKPLAMKVAAIGLTFVEHPVTRVVNVVDWVSGSDYPNVADFVEEVKRFGLSRRISKSAPIGRLTAESRVLLVHGRAYVENHAEYEPLRTCPTHRHQPMEIMLPPGSHCCALWWDDVTGGEHETGNRGVRRSMPSFEYSARCRPANVSPAYRPAIFAAFPIGQLTVITDPVGGTHEATLRAAEKASLWLPIVQEDE